VATIKDIAREAKVSTSTVSHVINKDQNVSENLTKKILFIMKKLDYTPNLIAKSLKIKKTNTIGLVLPDISDALLSELAGNIENILKDFNYRLIISNSEWDIKKESEIVRTLSYSMVDGLLVLPVAGSLINKEELERKKIPVIFLDNKVSGLNIMSVMVDNYRGSYDATTYLIGLGHRLIGYIGSNEGTLTCFYRKKGYKNALKDNNIKITKGFIIKTGSNYIDGKEAVKSFLALNKKPTAIMAEDDILAMGTIRGITDANLKVPEDISVLGFDDNPIASIYIPRLSTVHYPVNEIAKEACSILLDMINNASFKKNKDIVIEPRLIIRESTDRAMV
jgi:LacI family transcriptional regulator